MSSTVNKYIHISLHPIQSAIEPVIIILQEEQQDAYNPGSHANLYVFADHPTGMVNGRGIELLAMVIIICRYC